ncbi:hypothetical protein R1sor_022477 [Riccia sorocarpa]|uniref:HNH homing endonuclease n=1 Tax=Riccia sorocarpa TaxID=122646 RepID=A0ABD3GLH4_9MARC
MASVAFREAAIDEVAVYQHWAVDCSEEYMEALTSWEGSENPRNCFKEWVEQVVRPEVEAGSGLYWELRTWGRSAYRRNEFGATIRCVSRQDRVCVNRPNSAGNSRSSEKRRAIEHFRCQGELCITLDTETPICSVTCIHLEDHERPSWKDSKFPREALEFLNRVAEAGMRTVDVYRLLRFARSHRPLAHHQGTEAGETAKGFELILYEETTIFEAISFLTPFWRYVSTVKEVLTDSTFKTNDMRFEMFALIGNLGGFGVPLCYMFYLKKTSVDESTPNVTSARLPQGPVVRLDVQVEREGFTPCFFHHRQGRMPNRGCAEVHPGDARAVGLKHCLDAIERRMVAVDRGTNPYDPPAAHNIFPVYRPYLGPVRGDSNGVNLPTRASPQCKNFVSQHFNMHPLIPDLSGTERSAEELHQLAVYEAYTFCHERGLHRFWAYLWNEWYCSLWSEVSLVYIYEILLGCIVD